MNSFFDAFISYGRADSKAFATKLHKELISQGLKVWFDQNDIPLGVDFQNQIMTASRKRITSSLSLRRIRSNLSIASKKFS
jgi:hypothetical protein